MTAEYHPQPHRHILIVGAGAVGSLIGGRLAASGQRVTLLTRPATRAAILAAGLRVHAPGGDLHATPGAITALDELEALPDLVLLAAKAHAVESALPEIARLAGGAVVVTLQNGVGVEERLLTCPAIERLVAGSLTLSVSQDGPATVRQETESGGIALAGVRGNGEVESMAEVLRAAGIRTVVAQDYRAMKWSKLLLNLLANASSAIMALPPRAVYADPRLFRVEQAAFGEALAVMRTMNLRPIRLPGFNVPLLARAMRLPAPLARRLIAPHAASGRGDKRPSLWLDLDRGHTRTEIDWLNGAIVAAGARLGIPTPVNARLSRLYTAIAADPSRRAEFASRSDCFRSLSNLTAPSSRHANCQHPARGTRHKRRGCCQAPGRYRADQCVIPSIMAWPAIATLGRHEIVCC